MCVCSLWYPACQARAPYCHLWPVQVCSIFSTLSHKRNDFRKTNVKYVFPFSLRILSETFFILRIKRDMIRNVYRSSSKVPVILSDFNGTWILATYFRKILEDQISWKFGLWVSSSMRTDRRTSITKLIVSRFPQFLRTCLKMKYPVVLLLFMWSEVDLEDVTGR